MGNINVGGGGGGLSITSHQYFEIDDDGLSSSLSLTIAEVDLSKSVVTISTCADNDSVYISKGAYFNSATEVIVKSYVSGTAQKLRVDVYEFDGFKTLQYGTSLITTAATSETVRNSITLSTPVTQGKSLLFTSYRYGYPVPDAEVPIRFGISLDGTQLDLDVRSIDGESYVVYYFIVEFN